MTPQTESTPKVNPVIVWSLIILIALGMVIGYIILVTKYMPKPLTVRLTALTNAVEESEMETQLGLLLKEGKHDPTLDAIIAAHLQPEELSQSSEVLLDWLVRRRLPYLSRLEKNMTFIERSGKQVELKELKGKTIVACWVFTRCPRGCTGVAGEMKKLYDELKDNPDIHFLSVSVDPDDTPEDLKRFADGLGLEEDDRWWFVNGPKKEVRSAMVRYFGFNEVQDIPEADRMSPDDKFLHDMRVAVVDSGGHVRGFYGIANPDPEYAKFFQKRIRKDIRTLLSERDAAD
jgi:cytochrome oxidase Cu insertion factor (SCO1/SenC/PrrC family)